MGILKAKDVSVMAQQKEILRVGALEIAEGKRTAIIGPNGSGKSTLLKALSGFVRHARGEILFEGREIGRLPKKQIAQKMAVLPQGSSAPADLTVRELVDYGRFPHRKWWGGVSAEDEESVRWALAQTGLEPLQGRLVSTLSGGERQRAWIAMALAQKPRVLLLDEPTTYLDIAHQLEVMQTISSLNRDHALTVLMVLHDIYHAMEYADEVIVVKDGGIFAVGAPQTVVTPALIEAVFGVTAERFVNGEGRSVLLPVRLKK